MKRNSITNLVLFIVSAELIGALSALFTGRFSDFFDTYKRPPLSPPAWIFPVVWAILFATMGLSAYKIYVSSQDKPGGKTALTIYWAQLVFNFLWSIVFFRFEALWVAAVIIVILLLLIIAMIISFSKINKLAAYLNIPYLLWVMFATYLNIATAIIN